MKKHNIISVFFTLLVIGLLILSGPASAIDVSINDLPEVIDLAVDNLQDVDFTIQVKINDGEFLPLMYTDLILDYGDDSLTCKINNDNTIDDCNFLTVTKTIKDLNGGYGYGYGYSPNYGYGYDFGYGYGYSGSGTITYTLTVDVSEIPVEFLNNEIDVEARVYGGNENNLRYFRGTSSFNVNAESGKDIVDRTKDESVTYPNVIISIPANSLPDGVTRVNIRQVKPIDDTPTNTNFKILGKVYDFSTGDGEPTDFNDNLQITLTYTDEELTEAGITDESRIYPAFYNIITNDWEQLTVLSRDLVNNELTFLTNHFTQFTLLADTSTPTGGDTTPIGGGGGPAGRRATSVVITPPTPVVPEEVIPGEVPTVTPGEVPAAPTGLAAITGAVVGLLGTGGSIIVLILVICGVGFGSYFFVKKKKK